MVQLKMYVLAHTITMGTTAVSKETTRMYLTSNSVIQT